MQTFDDPSKGRPTALTLPSPAARNYVYFGGGSITFGKLTMRDADLQLIDADPRDPFDFFQRVTTHSSSPATRRTRRPRG